MRTRLYPDATLRQKAQPVTKFDEKLERLVVNMVRAMQRDNGVGLAGPQAGKALQVFVFRINEQSGAFVNPKLTVTDYEIVTDTEGCLSLPGKHFQVSRARAVKITAQNIQGVPVEMAFEGLPARVMQHEYDHLKGRLILDIGQQL